MSAIFLFDVDQTLVNTGGAGSLAMDLAFQELFGVKDGFQRIEFSGRMDAAIFRDAARLHGLPADELPALQGRFETAYVAHLAQTLPKTGGRVLPGMPEAVSGLAGTPGVRVGLATGNFRRGAMLKLEYYGLSEHLREGGFGEDSEDRAEMVALAVRRLGGGPDDDAFVIGDTPLDIAAAHANSFRAVAVATGRHSLDDLRAAGADLVFVDFGNVEKVLAELRRLAGGRPQGADA